MDNRSTINAFFKSLVPRLGFEIKLGEQHHLCNLKFGSGHSMIIELPNNGEILYMYTVIGDVPDQNREKFFEFILKLNFHANSTGTGTIGIDTRKNKLVLSQHLPIRCIDEYILYEAINRLLSTMLQLETKLKEFLDINKTQEIGEFKDGHTFPTPNLGRNLL